MPKTLSTAPAAFSGTRGPRKGARTGDDSRKPASNSCDAFCLERRKTKLSKSKSKPIQNYFTVTISPILSAVGVTRWSFQSGVGKSSRGFPRALQTMDQTITQSCELSICFGLCISDLFRIVVFGFRISTAPLARTRERGRG
jgi:hypothetical protein